MTKNHSIRRTSEHATTRRGHAASKPKRPAPPRLEALEDRMVPTMHVWTGLGGSDNWKVNGNWLVGGTTQQAPDSQDDVLVFPAGAIRKETNFNNFPADTQFASVSVESGYILSGARLVLGTGGFTSVSGSNLVRLTLDLPTSANGIPFNVQSGILQIGDTSGSLTGNGGLVKLGAGTMVLARSNSHEGDTTVDSGVLEITNSGALGTTAGKTVVKPTGTLEVDGNNLVISEQLVLQSTKPIGGVKNGTLRSAGGSNAWAGVVTLDTLFGAAVIDVASGQLHLGPRIVTDTIGGALIKNGSGTLVTTGNQSNTYTGSTTVNAGTLVLNKANNASAINGRLVIGDGVGANGSATVRLLAANQIANTSAIEINGDGRLDLNGFNETIGPLTMTGGLVTTGAGILTLNGNVTATSAASDAPARIEGLLDLGSTTTRVFTVNNGQADVDMAVPADLRPVATNLTKDGAGRMELGGANNHGGLTTVVGGFLRITDAAALGGTFVGTTVNDGATLEVAGSGISFEVPENLTLNGAGVDGGGALVFTAAPGVGASVIEGTVALASNTTVRADAGGRINGVVSGSGHLTKVGTGTFQLAAVNDYTGQTFVNEGILKVSNAQALGAATAGTTVADGATLFAGFVGGAPTSAEPLTLSGAGADLGSDQLTGALISGGSVTYTGNVTLASNTLLGALVDFTGEGNNSGLNLAGPISGAFDLEIVGDVTFSGATANAQASTRVFGALTLDKSPNTAAVSGPLIVEGGSVRVKSAEQIPNDVPVTFNGGSMNVTANETIGPLTLNAAGVVVSGLSAPLLTLAGDVIASGNSSMSGAISLGSATRKFTVAAGGELRFGILIGGSIIGTGGLIKDGPGRMQFLSDVTYTGPTTISAGTVFVGQDIASPITLNAGAKLTGHTTSPFFTGSVGNVTSNGGIVSPGDDPLSTSRVGVLNVTGNMALDASSTLHFDIGGTAPFDPVSAANTHDQVKVTGTGTLDLGNAFLDPTFINGFQPQAGNSFVLVENETTDLDSVVGRFTNPETGAVIEPGVPFKIGGRTFTVGYDEGPFDNDVILFAVNTASMAENLELAPGVVAVGESVVLSGNLIDPDVADTLTLIVNWGDGSAPEAFSDIGTSPFRYAHRYAAAGSYTVHVAWADQTGAGNSQNLQVQVVAPPRVEGVVVNDGSAQRSMVRSLTVTIDGEVTIGDGAFEVRRKGGGRVTVEVVSAVVNGQTVATLTFTGKGVVGGSLADGNYTLTIHGDRIRDSADQALDADGDGAAGGERVDAFFRLFGDSDGDRDVDVQDRHRFVGSLGKREGDTGFLDYFDHRGDGDVDLADRAQFLRRFGTRLPA